MAEGCEKAKGNEREKRRENKNCSITVQTRFFLSSLSPSPFYFFFAASDFVVQINVGRSGWLLLILALQLSNQTLSGNGVVIELHSRD